MQQNIRVLLLILFGAHAMGCGSDDKHTSIKDEKGQIRVRSGNEELVLVPGSASKARAESALPSKASEDVSHLLGKIDIPALSASNGKEKEYLPFETVEWVVTAEFPGNPRLDPAKVEQLFDKEWREKFGGFTSYGLDADTGRWTFAISADGPRAITQIKMEWSYVPFSKDAPEQTTSLYEQRLAEVSRKLKAFGEAKIKVSLPPPKAAKRAKDLQALKGRLDQSAVLVLKAPPGQRFDGKAIWDVMLCLGLQWGDMDCFHWVNPCGKGDDFFFSVETSTSPGYFLPEQIAAGRVQVDDLVFVFSIPRSHEPLQVFEGMVKATEYCQKRLGGQVNDEKGGQARVAEIRKRIRNIEQELRDAGLAPGSEDALRLF